MDINLCLKRKQENLAAFTNIVASTRHPFKLGLHPFLIHFTLYVMRLFLKKKNRIINKHVHHYTLWKLFSMLAYPPPRRTRLKQLFCFTSQIYSLTSPINLMRFHCKPVSIWSTTIVPWYPTLTYYYRPHPISRSHFQCIPITAPTNATPLTPNCSLKHSTPNVTCAHHAHLHHQPPMQKYLHPQTCLSCTTMPPIQCHTPFFFFMELYLTPLLHPISNYPYIKHAIYPNVSRYLPPCCPSLYIFSPCNASPPFLHSLPISITTTFSHCETTVKPPCTSIIPPLHLQNHHKTPLPSTTVPPTSTINLLSLPFHLHWDKEEGRNIQQPMARRFTIARDSSKNQPSELSPSWVANFESRF